MSTEIAEYEVKDRQLAQPTTAADMELQLAEHGKIVKVLNKFIAEHMDEGPDKDFGKIPGTEKNALLQGGAEKLTELFKLTPVYEETNKIERWDKADPLFHYEFKCKLKVRGTDVIAAEGLGSCNSMEDRYRWRNAQRKCPGCGVAAIFTSKKDGEGYYCWNKKGGCGKQFPKGDKQIEGQEQGRVENDGVFTQVNTILKMAKKRALVDAAIVLCRRYGFRFTQDLEDTHGSEEPEQRQQEAPRQQQNTKRNDPPSEADNAAAEKLKDSTGKQQEQLADLFVKLEFKWSDPAIRVRIEKAIGRPIAAKQDGSPQESMSQLKEHEAETLIRKLTKLVADKK